MIDDEYVREWKRVRKMRIWGAVAGAAVLAVLISGFNRYQRNDWLANADTNELKAAAQHEPEDETLAYTVSLRLVHEGLGDEAYSTMSRLVRRHPDSVKDLELFERTAAESAHVLETANICRRIIALAPGRADQHMNLGLMYYHAGLLNDANDEISTALRIDPNVPSNHVIQAKYLIAHGRDQDAWDYLWWRVQKNPTSDDVFRLLTDVGLRLGKNAELERILRQRIALTPMYDLPEPRAALARVMLAQKNDPGALPEAEALAGIAQKSKSAIYAPLMAEVQLRNGDTAGAKRTLEAGLRLQGDRSEIKPMLVTVLDKLGEKAQADALRAELAARAAGSPTVVALRAEVTAAPDDTPKRFALAAAMAADGDFEGALTQCREVLRYDPRNEQAPKLMSGYRDAALQKLEGSPDAQQNPVVHMHE